MEGLSYFDHHPKPAYVFAGFYNSQARYGEAVELLKRALPTIEGKIGVTHPDALWTVEKLANTYRGQYRYNERKPV